MISISNKQRASIVGVLILVAYSMLTYSITKNITVGVITDIISGLAVIGIPILLFPIFNSDENKRLNYAYLASRFIEGILMVIGGIFILNPSLESYREIIYSDIHIYFFISGALFFYILFYRTQVIPKFISVWGIIATLMLFTITIIKLFGFDLPILQVLLLPMILNELFLAVWLMIKGFNFETIKKN
ncbi:MAG: DUF4386 domain-containing protein [Bacteroidales bacterium]|nr:DUF4386 domain-containing protein [Bacteroidales bacterium]